MFRFVSSIPGIFSLSLLLTQLLSCATIEEKETSLDTFLRVEKRQQKIPDSTGLKMISSLNGTDLFLQLHETHMCKVTSDQIVHRQRKIERQVPSEYFWIEYGAAAALFLIGATTYFDAETLATESATKINPNAKPSQTDIQNYRIGGGVLFGAGFAPLAIGIADTIRQSDSLADDGEVIAGSTTEQVQCMNQPVPDGSAKLELGGKTTISGLLRGGIVKFSTLSFPLDALTAEDATWILHVTGVKDSLEVHLSAEQHEKLIKILADDSRSRAYKELIAIAKAKCENNVEAILKESASQPPEFRSQVAALEKSKNDCGKFWTSEMETKLLATQSLLVTAIENEKQENCRLAVEKIKEFVGSDALSMEAFETQRQEAQSACEGYATQMKQLNSLRQKVNSRLQEMKAAQLLEADVERVVRMIENGELASAHQKVMINGKLSSLLAQHGQVNSALSQQLQQALERLLSDGADQQSQKQLCLSRELFKMIFGTKTWKTLIKKIAQENSEKNPLGASRVIQLLQSGKC